MRSTKSLAVAALAALTAAGCLDLDVQNPNAADAERALRTPGDVEALIGGGFGTWWNSSSANTGIGPVIATVSYMHSATAANFGMVEFSGWPKVPVHHTPADVYYGQFANNWTWHYRAVSAVVDGLRALEAGVELSASDMARAQAYGYFVLGLAHGSTALLFDQGYIYDPSIDVEDVSLHPYPDVMNAALGYLDRAIQEAQGQNFTVPSSWMSFDVSAAQLIRLANSYKARFRANIARSPAERAAVNWQQVIADASAGVTEDWSINVSSGSGFTSGSLVNMPRYGPWGQLSYQVMGMADQSGRYQRWIAMAPDDRHPNLSPDQSSDPFLIETPDLRFPRGSTIEEQQATANRGTKFEIPTASGGYGAQWNRPDRGTFRWSYYRSWENNQWLTVATRDRQPEVTLAEMRMLRAEGLYRTGDRAGAAALVNVSRTEAGLNATDADGTNTSCVPKLPSGACGGLFEMLKWESRLETMYKGLHLSSWYFNGRGWGDLAEGSFLHLPVPGREAELLGIPLYTFGGTNAEGAAPVGTYGY